MTDPTERLQLKIGGMHCSFCATSITRGLEKMPGVAHAAVSIAHEEALIEYHPAQVTAAQLTTTLQDLGYTIRDPRRVKAYEEQQREIEQERRRLIGGAILTGLALVQMALMWFHLVPRTTLGPIMAVAMPLVAMATVFGPAFSIVKMAWHSMRRGILNQHVLLEFGAFSGLVGGALGLMGRYGHVASLRFPAPDFFAVATFISTYHMLSGYASLLVRTKASRSVLKLLALQPPVATVVRDNEEREVPVDEVQLGEHVRIRPGQAIPLDGEVINGTSGVDEALVTGESLPIEKKCGSPVIGGSMNLSGTLVIQVTRIGDDSFVQSVAREIEEARARKPSILQLVDRVLAWYVPGVLVAAALTVLLWTVGAYVLVGHVLITRGIFAMLAVFVMGYPCALGMATPLAMIRGGGIAAEHGILIRGGEAFQALKDVRRVAFDKTGTLTEGRPVVTHVVPLGDVPESRVLALAAAVEAVSEHPLAQAILDRAAQDGQPLTSIADFTAVPGRGVRATLDGHPLLVGSPRFVSEAGIAWGPTGDRIQTLQVAGNTVVGVAYAGEPVGLIAIADAVKADAPAAIAFLRTLGLEPLMLTGDNLRTAQAVAAAVGIATVRAEVLPAEKAAAVRELQQSGTRVMMVGDGINDAPALTQADVGVAIGAGTDIAIEAADVVLMGDRLHAVAAAVEVGRNAYRKTAQNIGLAFAFNGVGIPLAMTGLVTPAWAMLAMVVSVSLVLANSFAGGRRPDRGGP